MQHWTLEIGDIRGEGEPKFIAIARAIEAAIRSGRLRRGDPLPGSRTLATELGVHRNTVLAALGELAHQGLVVTTPARGTFVAETSPDPLPHGASRARLRARQPSRIAFSLNGARPSVGATAGRMSAPLDRPRKDLLPLLGGMPDLRLLPSLAIARAYRRALSAKGRTPLSYGDPHGDERLRVALSDMLGRVRGIARAHEGLVVTRGSQMAIYLAARAIVAPGDRVVVESYGYRPAWEALRLAGAKLVPVAVDADGIDVERVARVCTEGRVSAVYVTPHHQYPTTARLSQDRRGKLLHLARSHGFAILEDDYDHEFHYDGRPTLPLASADVDGSVVYIGTLSKVLAPGLRIGFAVAPEPLAERMAELRSFIDRQGDLVVERAIAELLEDGEVLRHVRKMRRIYHARRDALAAALDAHLGRVFDFDVPAGGLAIWAKVREGLSIDVDAWAEAAERNGAVVHPGSRFSFERRQEPAFRLGYAPLDEREIDTAVRRFRDALPAKTLRPSPSAHPSRAARRPALTR